MSKLIRSVWMRWTLFVALLIGLGVGIYEVEQPEPMCEIDAADQAPYYFGDNGQRLIIGVPSFQVHQIAFRLDQFAGPLHVWDTRTGRKQSSHFATSEILTNAAVSRDGRYFAWEMHKVLATVEDRVEELHAIIIVDAVTGAERQIPLENRDMPLGGLLFSPAGDLLLRMAAGEAKPIRIFEHQTGKPVVELDDGFIDFTEELSNELFLIARGDGLDVWSWRERKRLGHLENIGPNHSISPDGRLYVAERLSPEGAQIGKWGVWELADCRLQTEYESEDILVGARTISADGRWLAAACLSKQGNYVELRDLKSGKQVATFAGPTVRALDFSPDGRFLLLQYSEAPANRTMLEVPSFRVLWQKERRARGDVPILVPPSDFIFSADSRTVFFNDADGREVFCLECATGVLRRSMVMPRDNSFNVPTLHATPDRRRLLVHELSGPEMQPPKWRRWLAWLRLIDASMIPANDTTIVLDTDTCRERFRLIGWNTAATILSDDGRTLATVHETPDMPRVIRCWDVDAWKPLHWPIGVPAAIGAIGVLFAWWRWRRATRRQTSVVQ